MANTKSSARDVLIAGAGPTGLSLAITCRQFGVPVRIIDRAPQPSGVSKALAVWSASLEALEGMGVVQHFLSQGLRMRELAVISSQHRLATVPVGEGIDSPYPFPVLLPQSRTEQILGQRLAELGTTVERSVELVGLTQNEAGVTATLRHADGREETARAAYLAGCDGARSAVRHALDIGFEGETEPQTFLLCDARIEGGGLDPASIYLCWRRGGAVALFPVQDGVWRLFAMRGNGSAEPTTTLEELQGLLDAHGPGDMRLYDPSWLSVFRINERVALHFRAGRCFLAGDAAHVHSPAGGQGMNTGIQDATNLGWKLAHILQGRGDAELLLDSYGAERRPVAQAVVKGAALKQHLAFANDTLTRLAKEIAIPILSRVPGMQKRLQVELSETDITYREGSLVALGDPPRRPHRGGVGTRARDAGFRDPQTGDTRQLWPLLSGPHHTLLLFGAAAGQELPADLADAGLRVVRLDDAADPDREARERYRIGRSGWVLIRPDQVVAARGEGTGLDGLSRYAARVLRPAG